MTQTKTELLQTRHQGDIRLGDADSSHYVGFKAPATVSSSLVWTLPAADGSASQILKTDGSGNLGWASDSATDTTKMPLAGGTFTGNTIYNDGIKAIFGTSSDGLEIHHSSNNSYIEDSGTGGLVLLSNGTLIETKFGAEHAIRCTKDGGVELYYNNVKTFETETQGIQVLAPDGYSAFLRLYADRGDDNADQYWLKTEQDGTGFYLQNNVSGSTETNLKALGNGTVELFYDNDRKFKTISTGAQVESATGDCHFYVHAEEDNSGSDAIITARVTNTSASGYLMFGDADDINIGKIRYMHSTNSMLFYTSDTERFRFGSGGQLGIGGGNWGTSGQVLTSGGSGAAVSWTTIAGGLSSDSQKNTVGGTNAGDSFTGTDANDNTLIGYDAGTAITSGDQNVCIGSGAGESITTGANNVTIGFEAGLNSNNSGIIAIGYHAAHSVTGTNNTVAISGSALYSLTTGPLNNAIGTSALYTNQTGWSNCAFGVRSLKFATASYNTAFGTDTGQKVTTGNYNTYLGNAAGPGGADCTGNYNTGIGQQTLHSQGGADLSGANNTCIGGFSGYYITTASHNTCVGHKALNVATTGWSNTCLGFESGKAITTGIGNVGIGYDSLTSNSPSGNITTGNYNVCLGDNRITNLYCADTSISSSDSRDKTDVTSFTHGLDWITQLRPVTYRWDRRSWYEDRTPDGSRKRDKIHLGFIAQEAIEVEKKFGYADKKDNFLVANQDEDVNNPSYGFKYERLVPILVNAIKELSAKVEALEAK